MPFCGKCGTAVDPGMSFCGQCGAPLASATAGAQPTGGGSAGYQAPTGPPAAGAPAPTVPPPVSTPLASNVAGLLTYVLGFITGIVFLVIEPYKNDRFVRFHAFQSILFSGVAIGFSIVWMILESLMLSVAYGLWYVLFLIWVAVRLGFFVIWLFLLYKAYNNERFMLPIIGPIAAKQAG